MDHRDWKCYLFTCSPSCHIHSSTFLSCPTAAFRKHLAVHGKFGHLHAAAISLPRGAATAPSAQELPSCHQQHGGQVISECKYLYLFLCFQTVWFLFLQLFVCFNVVWMSSALLWGRFANATSEELAANDDDCAICWDTMQSARKLPCGHLFHK